MTASDTGQGMPNTVIQFYQEAADDFIYETTTDADGYYSQVVAPGNYAVVTQNIAGYINEIYNNVPCSSTCDVNAITLMAVTTNSFTNIDFALDPGGRVSGTVTDASNGTPIANVTVFLADPGGQVPFTKGVTNASGVFVTEGGTAAGNVYALTQNSLGYRNEVFNNVYCSNCDPAQVGATLIAVAGSGTTGGVNFALDLGGRVSGTVRDGNGIPIAHASVGITDASFTNTDQVNTDAAGHYSSGGLPAGTYYVQASSPFGHVTQAWNGVYCPNGFCNIPAVGAPISVTIGGNAANVDFSLPLGGQFSGSVTNAAGGAPVPITAGGNTGIAIYNSIGVQVLLMPTDNNGLYTTPPLPPGTYYAQTMNVAGFGNNLYASTSCGGCQVLSGTAIVVTAGNTTGNINFSLSAAGTITGTVTAVVGGGAIANQPVQFFSTLGIGAGNTTTNASGVYTLSTLPAGSYYVRTNGAGAFMNELYNDIPCQNCALIGSAGTLVTVSPGAVTSNINFALATGGRISGTVTNSNGGAALSGIPVQIVNTSGLAIGTFNTNGAGLYTTAGLPPGDYYVRTQSTGSFINKLYNDISCPAAICAPTSGAKVTVTGTNTTSGINFALSTGGRISGQVTTAGGAPLSSVTIQLYNSLNRFAGTVNTDLSGNYTTAALPDGDYFIRTANSLGYLDEVYDNAACDSICSPITGTPITIAGGANVVGKNFALAAGGFVGGTVRDAGTTNPISGVLVTLFTSGGQIARTATTISNGSYVISGLAPGTYYLRTANQLGYKDKIYNNLPFCDPDCVVTDGAPITVTVGSGTTGIDLNLVAGTELLQNPSFANGTTNWSLFANLPDGTPDNNQLVWQVVNGTLQYYRTTNSASGVFLQNTHAAVAQGQGVLAQFDFANTSDVRKRISVLVHDGDFSDLFVCTFWAPPNSGSRRYGVLTHAAKAWTNATISLYAASADTNGGFYQIDNVTLQTVDTPPNRTVCTDPFRPAITPAPDGPELLVNGNFGTNDTTGWTVFGQMTSQVTAGVFEFLRPSANPNPAGVILQPVGAGAGGQIYNARFSLGNSSAVRKRVTVLMHDLSFGDLTACTFWLEPNTPLAAFGMQGYATQAWGNATLSVYASSIGDQQWTRLDNVSFKKTTGAITAGTECYEPLSVPNGPAPPVTGAAPAPNLAVGSGAGLASQTNPGIDSRNLFPDSSVTSVTSVIPDGWLHLESRRPGPGAARVEISIDGGQWQLLTDLPGSDDWISVDIDLSPYAGHRILIRVVSADGDRGDR